MNFNRKSSTLLTLIGIIGVSTLLLAFQTDYISQLKHKIIDANKTTSPKSHLVDTYGIDVSHHQGEIEWGKVKKWKDKKISFVYIKATEGATYIDKTYNTNFSGAKQNGLLVGSYHYFRTSSSIENQLKNLTTVVDKNTQDLVPLIDVEEMKYWSSAEFHNNFNKFLKAVEKHYGKKPMIYTVNSFYNMYLSGKYKQYHFLIGRYGKNAPNMRDKSNWTIWQFSETARVEGIPKLVDIDVINKKYSLEDLKM